MEGALSSDAVIRDVQVSDKDGVWMTLDRARLVWRRTALLNIAGMSWFSADRAIAEYARDIWGIPTVS